MLKEGKILKISKVNLKMTEYEVPYGNGGLNFQIPERFDVEVLDEQLVPEIPDEKIKKHSKILLVLLPYLKLQEKKVAMQ